MGEEVCQVILYIDFDYMPASAISFFPLLSLGFNFICRHILKFVFAFDAVLCLGIDSHGAVGAH